MVERPAALKAFTPNVTSQLLTCTKLTQASIQKHISALGSSEARLHFELLNKTRNNSPSLGFTLFSSSAGCFSGSAFSFWSHFFWICVEFVQTHQHQHERTSLQFSDSSTKVCRPEYLQLPWMLKRLHFTSKSDTNFSTKKPMRWEINSSFKSEQSEQKINMLQRVIVQLCSCCVQSVPINSICTEKESWC